MLISFLQFLNFGEVFRLSLTCRDLRRMIDPNGSCRDDNRRITGRQRYKTHLKIIAAIQLLDNGDDLSFDHITKKFGVDVTRVTDL